MRAASAHSHSSQQNHDHQKNSKLHSNHSPKLTRKRIIFERSELIAIFREWFSQCGQSLKIIGPSQSGKTYFAKQLSQLPECVASHFCRCDEPQSSESATLIRSLGDQLMRRFPNLVLPRLATVTLLRDPPTALEHFLQMPLETMPRPSKPVFLVIDNVSDEPTRELVEMIREILPRWVRIVTTTRRISEEESKKVHIIELGKENLDLERFIRNRLPHCSSSVVLSASKNSWFFVDQLSRAIELGVLSCDVSVPESTGHLVDIIAKQLPGCYADILRLAKTFRCRPTRQQLLATGQMLIPQEMATLERDLLIIQSVICELNDDSESDVFDVPEVWQEYVGNDKLRCHSAWAEHYKTKRRKSSQDIVELAYHLAHSSVNSSNAIRTLQSVGAGQILLRSPVIDVATTKLLSSAGTLIECNNYDVVYACSVGKVKNLEHIITEMKPSNIEICFGLLTAAARGNLEMCRYIVENFPNVAVSSCCGEWNALRSAACNGQLDILKLLLSKGINVDECGHSDRTALRAAAWSGQLSAVQLLLQTGADVDRRDSEQRTALMAAAFMGHRDVVAVILQYGADINAVDKSGATALHLNMSNGSKEDEHRATTDILLENNASCTIEDANGRVVLHLAAYHGDDSLPEILKKSSSVDVQDNMGQTPLILAACQGQMEAVRYLVELVDEKADVDCIDMNGRTALQWAAINGHRDMVQYLCSIGSDEAHKDNDGAVALHYAVAHDDVELARILMNEQTVKATDRYGQHPLLVACGHGNLQVISELINHSAPVNLAALDGRTPLSVAATAGHSTVIEILAPYISDWTQADHDGTPLVHQLILANQTYTAEILLNIGASTSAKDVHGRSCAHVVASTNDLNASKMLRRVGTSFEVVDDGGRTPLMTAIWSRNSQIAFYLLDSCGVDPNRFDLQGATALSIASQIGDRDLVGLLLRFGAELSIRDAMGRTALEVARLSGHESIVAMLKAANGSSDSSGIGSSVPNSPMDVTKSRTRRSTSSVRPKVIEKQPMM